MSNKCHPNWLIKISTCKFMCFTRKYSNHHFCCLLESLIATEGRYELSLAQPPCRVDNFSFNFRIQHCSYLLLNARAMRYSTLTSECASDTTVCASRWTVSVHVLCADWKEVAKSAELSLHLNMPRKTHSGSVLCRQRSNLYS